MIKTRNDLCIDYGGSHLPVSTTSDILDHLKQKEKKKLGNAFSPQNFINNYINDYAVRGSLPQHLSNEFGRDAPYTSPSDYQRELRSAGGRGCGTGPNSDGNSDWYHSGSGDAEMKGSQYCHISYIGSNASVCTGLQSYPNIDTSITTVGGLFDGQNVGIVKLDKSSKNPLKTIKTAILNIFLTWMSGACACCKTNCKDYEQIKEQYNIDIQDGVGNGGFFCKGDKGCIRKWVTAIWAEVNNIGVAAHIIHGKDEKYLLLVVNYDKAPYMVSAKGTDLSTKIPNICAAQSTKLPSSFGNTSTAKLIKNSNNLGSDKLCAN